MKSISTGIDQLETQLPRLLKKYGAKRVGILCHPSSASRQLKHLEKIVDQSEKLTALFGPQHGIHGETQDNMIEWQDTRDSKNRPVYSLYGERRRPSNQALSNIDLMIIDLFDVGARYYTFIYTMAYTLEACAELQIPVIICDRPNPLGGSLIEGPILDLNYRSFVGLYELPVCHGLTLGELAQFFISKMSIRPPLEILKLKGWNRKMFWPETGLTWTLPSPNMPQFSTAVFYPGMCLLEGTSLSEGRGTTRPFELIGAPFFEWSAIEKEYNRLTKQLNISAAIFHQQGFIPTFHKFSGELCKGALQICPDPRKFKPLRHATLLLWIFRKLYGDAWKWKAPPYEYEYEKLPIDILAGGPKLREFIDEQRPLGPLFASWTKDEALFSKTRKPFILY